MWSHAFLTAFWTSWRRLSVACVGVDETWVIGISENLLGSQGHVEMLLHGLEVSADALRPPVPASEAGEAAESLDELRRRVGLASLEVVNSEQCIVVETCFPEGVANESLGRQRRLAQLLE